MNDLYKDRRLSEGYPDLDKVAFDRYTALLSDSEDDPSRIGRMLTYLNRLVDLSPPKRILVVGCGPIPKTAKSLLERNHDVVGIEPVEAFASSAAKYIGSEARILTAAAEKIPVPDCSQDLVLCESVLEHVDSPLTALNEVYRVLVPGGILFISTTNRYRFSLTGYNGEYNIRYFNWLPRIVKECFVFQHLHYRPHIANYSQRPAVHWYTFADLCELGRKAGFSKFYSMIDLLEPDDADDTLLMRNRLRRFLLLKLKLLKRIKRNPFLRALALTQIGGTIIMFKRSS